LASEDDACAISTRQRVVEKMSDILIDLRMIAKSLNKRDIKAPLIMGENKPVHMDLVVVDELPD
jgi:hypothetical protein